MADRIQRVLVVTAHPDDSEFGAGGTVAKLVREGKQVTYCILTNGDKGSGRPRDDAPAPRRDPRAGAAERRSRARAWRRWTSSASPIASSRTRARSRRAVTAAIRRHRPDLLITQNPNRTKNLGASHRDHRTAGRASRIDCVYPLARDHMAFPELLEQGLEPHKVREVYLMWWDSPEVVVDITDTIDLKLKALSLPREPTQGHGGRREARARARGGARQAPWLRVRRDVRAHRHGSLNNSEGG